MATGSPTRLLSEPLQVRVLSRVPMSPWWNGNHASLRSSRCRSDSGRGCSGGIGQRKAARPSTWKRRVRFPLPSPRSRRSLARSPGLQSGESGSKPLGSTGCPRSLMEQAPDYGSGSWGFESSRGCNGSGAGAQSRLIRATWRDRHPREPPSHRSVVQWQGRGPTNRRREFDSLRSDHARVSIWRGCPAVYRVRRVRFPSRAPTWRSSRESSRSISERLRVRVSPPGRRPRPDSDLARAS